MAALFGNLKTAIIIEKDNTGSEKDSEKAAEISKKPHHKKLLWAGLFDKGL